MLHLSWAFLLTIVRRYYLSQPINSSNLIQVKIIILQKLWINLVHKKFGLSIYSKTNEFRIFIPSFRILGDSKMRDRQLSKMSGTSLCNFIRSKIKTIFSEAICMIETWNMEIRGEKEKRESRVQLLISDMHSSKRFNKTYNFK